MQQVELAVTPRSRNTKNANRRLRRAGRLPAVIYGGGGDTQAIELDAVSFGKLLPKTSRTAIFRLQVEGGETQAALIREIQRDPVYDTKLIHIDFLRVNKDEAIVVEVPVHGLGTPEGVKLGGILEALLRRITVRCLPFEIPASFDIDISELLVGQSVKISDLETPEGVEILMAEDLPLFIVQGAKVEEEVETPEGEEGEGAEGAEGAEGEGAEGDDAEKKKE